MAQPIRPEDVVSTKGTTFPEAVIKSFNEQIAQHLVNGRAIVDIDDVIQLMVKKGLTRRDIYAKGWLSVENIHLTAGWTVEYRIPSYNDAYTGIFIFKKDGRGG